MVKKKVLIIAGGIGVSLIAVIFTLLVRQRQEAFISPIQSPVVTQEKKTANLITYKDTAGFKFEYPENLQIKDVSGNDETVYSSLEITTAETKGKMILKVADANFASIDSWLKSQEASGAGSTREITIAGMPGKQIQFDNPKRLVSLAVNEGIMYFLQSPLDEANFWNKIHNNILSSFVLNQNGNSNSQGSEGTVYEEEEIVN